MTGRGTPIAALWLCACAADWTVCMDGYGADESGACVPVGEESAAPGGADSGTPAVTVDSPAVWTASEVEEALRAGLVAGLPDPWTLGRAWTTAIDTGGTPGCPASAGYSLVQGVEGCTSAAGWTFAGPADWIDDEHGGFLLEADSYILRASGTQLAYGGLVTAEIVPDGDDVAWRTSVEGTFVDESATGWAGTGVSASLAVKGERRSGEVTLLLDGGSSVGTATVTFEALTWSSCGLTGALGAVDRVGRGYRATFSCSLCGPASTGTEALGEVCVSDDALVDLAARMEAP